jgi:hypothetical protein
MFQDRLVLAIWSCFQTHHPFGRAAVDRLFQRLFARGMLDPTTLDDQGLLLLVAACPDGGPLREAVNAAFAERGLDQPGAVPRLREARRRGLLPNDEDLVGALRYGTTGQRQQARVILRQEHGPQVRLFRGRLFLASPVEQTREAELLLARSCESLSRIPAGTMDFLAHVYRSLVTPLPLETIPDSFPAPPPSWFTALSAEERWFIEACLRLGRRSDRMLAYLCVYARLDIPRMAVAASGAAEVPEETAARSLELALSSVFDEPS